jgi:glutamate/tyrosine decarboxylase-like PLP-dependent enzyme
MPEPADGVLPPLGAGAAALDAAVADLAARFRAALEPPERVGAAIDAPSLRARLDEPLPDRGLPVEEVLPALVERVTPGLVGTTAGGYLGYVTGGVLPAAAIAQAWAVAVDQNAGLWALSPAATELELLALRWLADLLELPHPSATFTSGAAGANLVSLAVARHWAGERHGIDVNAEGVAGLHDLTVYGSTELHFTDVKALRTLGLGNRCLRPVPVDAGFRMDVTALRTAIAADVAAGQRPGIVIASSGSPNTGAADDLNALADVCAEHGLWLHVDAAFGAFFRLAEATAPLVAGLERADSVTVDGHKWLNLPNGIGFAFLRDERLHHETFAGTAGYLTRAPGSGDDLHEYGVEASRPWRGAATWAALKSLGREGVAELVGGSCAVAQELGRLVEDSPRLELTAPVVSCVTCFRYRPAGWEDGDRLDDLNRAIQQRLAHGERVVATGGMLPSGFSLRPAIVNWRTSSADAATLVEETLRAGDELAARA